MAVKRIDTDENPESLPRRINVLIKLPIGLYERIPKPKSKWVFEVVSAAAGRLPAVERDGMGEVMNTYAFLVEDEVFISKGACKADAWGGLGLPGMPRRHDFIDQAIKDGWYVPPKSVTQSFLEDM